MQILVQIFKNIRLCCLRLEQLAVVCKRYDLASDVIWGISGVTNRIEWVGRFVEHLI